MTQGIASRFRRVFNAFRNPWKTPRDLPLGAFEPLIPVLLEDEHTKRYESELLHSLRNEHVRNIALTGAYGAGKSSVIKTFFENHATYTPVFVSLATFSKEVQDDPQPADSDLMSRIEETIVQQLLYAVPADKLPKTRLKRIVQASNARIVVRTVFFTLLIATGLRFYLPSLEPLPKFVPEGLLPQLLLVSDGWALLIAMGLVAWLLYGALKFLSLFSIDGLTLKGGKLEATHHGSVLHKHVDEVIYCFERSNIDVVVIEDLDRFGIQDVFFRLREINFTIQQSPQVRRPVHFIYAIRDELFSVGDKTKFFDLIIPIIPVVNSENSREKMMELLRAKRFDAELIKSLDPVLIETVCYYIDEMRLVKNIVNEFDMFSSLLGSRGVQLEANKLLAMVVVRNLYPEAFADLIKRRGVIHSVFTEFGDWRNDRAIEIDVQIPPLREQLAQIEGEHLASVEELRVCVWYQIIKSTQAEDSSELGYDNEGTVTLAQFVQDEFFDEVFRLNRVLTMPAYGSSLSVRSDQVLKLASYQQRVARLTCDRENLIQRINRLKAKSVQTRRMSFKAGAKGEYAKPLAQALKGLDALIYLMRTGHFGTDYNDYLGFFYPGSLTQDDKNLILAVRRGESLDVTSVVEDPATVIIKLDHDDLADGRGLIAELVDYLCSQPSLADDDPNSGKLAVILNSASECTQRFAEVVDCILSSRNVSALIQVIYEADPLLFKTLLATSRFEDNGPRQALICAMFSSLGEEQIAAFQNDDAGVLENLAGLRDVTQVVPLLAEGKGVWGGLRESAVQFNNLSDTTAADDLKQLLSWGCIAPRLAMLELICLTFEKENRDEEAVTYQRLLALQLDGVDKLLSRDPHALIKQLLSQDGMLDESAESLGALLAGIGSETKGVESLLERTDCQFTALEVAPVEAWGNLLNADRVSDEAQAVWTYLLRPVAVDTQGEPMRFLNVDGGTIRSARPSLNAFLERNVEALIDTLWALESEYHRELQRYLLQQTTISNDTLLRLLSNTTLKSLEILVRVPDMRWGMLVVSTFLPYSEEASKIVQNRATPSEAAYFEKRKSTSNATN